LGAFRISVRHIGIIGHRSLVWPDVTANLHDFFRFGGSQRATVLDDLKIIVISDREQSPTHPVPPARSGPI
jgi:hypothetical protein